MLKYKSSKRYKALIKLVTLKHYFSILFFYFLFISIIFLYFLLVSIISFYFLLAFVFILFLVSFLSLFSCFYPLFLFPPCFHPFFLFPFCFYHLFPLSSCFCLSLFFLFNIFSFPFLVSAPSSKFLFVSIAFFYFRIVSIISSHFLSSRLYPILSLYFLLVFPLFYSFLFLSIFFHLTFLLLNFFLNKLIS